MRNWLKTIFNSSGFIYLFCEIVSKAIPFLCLPIFTNLLSKEEFGKFSLYVASIPILAIFIDLSQRIAVKRFYLEYKNQIYYLMQNIYLTILAVALILQLVLEYTTFIFIDKQFSRIVIISASLFAMIEVCLAYLQIKELPKKYNLVYLLRNSLPYIGAAFCFYIGSQKAILFAYIQIVVNALIVIVILYFVIIKQKNKFLDLKYFKYSLSLSLPVIPAAMAALFLSFSDRFMIQYFYSGKEVAEYSIAYTIGTILSVVFLALNKAWQPFILNNLKLNKIGLIAKYARYYILG